MLGRHGAVQLRKIPSSGNARWRSSNTIAHIDCMRLASQYRKALRRTTATAGAWRRFPEDVDRAGNQGVQREEPGQYGFRA
jgi:hypothetical protein